MRWATSALLAATLAALTPGLAAEPAMFRADARHGGIYDAAGVAVLHGAKWTFRTGGAVISTPVVASGTVYFGSSDHNLYALDAASGTLRWKFATAGRVTSSPAVADGRVYFGSFDSNLYALDAASGALVWKFTTAGERRFSGKHLHGAEPAAEVMPDPFDVFLSSPVVVAGVVYFGSGDGNVYALDGASGALRWKFPTGNVVHASPALAAGTLYVGSWDSYFYALDAASGKQRWRFKTGEDPKINNQVGIQSSAVVADGVVYFGCRDSHLYALDAATGTQRWAFSTGESWVISSPAVRDGKSLLRDQRLGARAGTRCADRHAGIRAGLQPLAVLLIAIARWKFPVHRLGAGEAPGDRSHRAAPRLVFSDRELEEKWRPVHQCRWHSELQRGVQRLLL